MRKLTILLITLFSVTASAADTSPFWVWDLTVMPPAFRKPTFTHYRGAELRNNKDRVELWVEENLGEHAPDELSLDKLLDILSRHAFEDSIDPTTSLLEIELRVFGAQPTPPSGDRRFDILIAAIPPYEKNGQEFGFDGFFNAYDQLPEADAQKDDQHSNERDIVYVNALQDINTPYMRGVIAHELAHLITYAQLDPQKNPLDNWTNELLGEAAMQLTGYYTDVDHVRDYRAHPEWPLAVKAYGVSYGGLSLFAEYLMKTFDPMLIGGIAPAQGDGFARISAAYKKTWNELLEGYVTWLFEQTPASSFEGDGVPIRKKPLASLRLGPTGVVYLPRGFNASQLRVTAVPKGCLRSQNVLRTKLVQRANPGTGQEQAQAAWIESTPPCAAQAGEQSFGKDSFTLTRK